jgi:uncharacterized protein
MKRDGRRSGNIDDRRGQRMASTGGGLVLLMRFLPFLLRTKVGRLILLVAGGLYLASFLGFDFGLRSGLQQPDSGAQRSANVSPAQQELADFVSVVLADTEDTWHTLFAERNGRYAEPTLVLFTGAVNSACGQGRAAMGPFYCPADGNVYIDLSFYDQLRTRHGVAGDFAQAYVIAHEIGHHVQNITGILNQINSRARDLPAAQANQLSVRQELQADCFAGLWAHHANRTRQILEDGDIEEALAAAAAIGDDRLQSEAQGRVRPETFTHGTSQQRMHWFRTGLEQGTIEACDTFAAQQI